MPLTVRFLLWSKCQEMSSFSSVIGLFLNGVVEDEDARIVFNGAHHGFDELPEGFGVKALLG